MCFFLFTTLFIYHLLHMHIISHEAHYIQLEAFFSHCPSVNRSSNIKSRGKQLQVVDLKPCPKHVVDWVMAECSALIDKPIIVTIPAVAKRPF